jgi:hypothetical protein
MPLVAIAPNGTWTPADVNVAATESPDEWAAHIQALLP